MDARIIGLLITVTTALGITGVRGDSTAGNGRVRYKPYFTKRSKTTQEPVVFYKAIYPPDYTDLSIYSREELSVMMSAAEGPEDTPVFQKVRDDMLFGRSRICRETKLTDHDLARRCLRADLFFLGMRRATVYTLWNLYVYYQPVLIFFVTVWLSWVGSIVSVQLGRFFVNAVTSFGVTHEELVKMLSDGVKYIYPGSYITGSDLRWNPQHMEILKRARLKAYYSYLMRFRGGQFFDTSGKPEGDVAGVV